MYIEGLKFHVKGNKMTLQLYIQSVCVGGAHLGSWPSLHVWAVQVHRFQELLSWLLTCLWYLFSTTRFNV